MKAFWLKWSAKIDALSLRERTIIFFLIAISLLVVMNIFVFDTQFAQQRMLSNEIKGNQAEITAMQADIQARLANFSNGPNRDSVNRLHALEQERADLQGKLVDLQKGMVAPDRMGALLQDLVKQNGRLRVVSVKTLPVASGTEPLPEAKPDDAKSASLNGAPDGVKALADNAAKQAASASNSASGAPDGKASTKAQEAATGANASLGIYRHGVEIAVQGDYFDLVNYMKSLENMPWRLFWARAHLDADEKSRLTLTLTVFTLSLDPKWLNI